MMSNTGYIQPKSTINRKLLQRRKVYRWTNGNIKYECFHENRNAAFTDTSWEIRKFSQSGEDWDGFIFGAVNTESVINALAWNF